MLRSGQARFAVVLTPVLLGLCPPTCPDTVPAVVEMSDAVEGQLSGPGHGGYDGYSRYVEAELSDTDGVHHHFRLVELRAAQGAFYVRPYLDGRPLAARVEVRTVASPDGTSVWVIDESTLFVRVTFDFALVSLPPPPPREPEDPPSDSVPVGCGGSYDWSEEDDDPEPTSAGCGSGQEEEWDDEPTDSDDNVGCGSVEGDDSWEDSSDDGSDEAVGCGGVEGDGSWEDEDDTESSDSASCGELEGDDENSRTAARALRFMWPFAMVLGINRRERSRCRSRSRAGRDSDGR